MDPKKPDQTEADDLSFYTPQELANLAALDKIYDKNVTPQDLVKELAKGKADQHLLQLGLLTKYYQNVLIRANQSFWVATATTVVGLAGFIGAFVFLLLLGEPNAAIISAVGSGILEFIAVINYVIYGRTTAQFSSFHRRLSRLQMVLQADDFCDKIGDEVLRNETRAALAQDIIRSNPATTSPTKKKTRTTSPLKVKPGGSASSRPLPPSKKELEE